MTNAWIQHPIYLCGAMVELRALEKEQLDELFTVACNPGIWMHTSVDYSDPEIFYPNFNAALRDRDSGRAYPFLIVDRKNSQIIGTTRLLEIHFHDRKLEIGITWIDSTYWGTGVNMECKFLLLKYCFEHLCVNRVQFRAKAENARSRRALEKIGATFEGIQRKDKIEPSGVPRNTAFYSITNDDWPEVQASLIDKIRSSSTAV